MATRAPANSWCWRARHGARDAARVVHARGAEPARRRAPAIGVVGVGVLARRLPHADDRDQIAPLLADERAAFHHHTTVRTVPLTHVLEAEGVEVADERLETVTVTVVTQ